MQQDVLFSAASSPSSVPAVPRADLYGPVHKGLRWALTSVLTRLGTTDFADAERVAVTLDELDRVLFLCASHVAHENRHIHPMIARARPDLADQLDAEHRDHERAIDELRAKSTVIGRAPAADVPALGRMLHLRFSIFVAENLAHMAEEEIVVQPLLESVYRPDELAALEGAIVASIAPDELMAFTKVMVPGNGRELRAAMLAGAKAAMPPEAFVAFLRSVRPSLDEADWSDLVARLDVVG